MPLMNPSWLGVNAVPSSTAAPSVSASTVGAVDPNSVHGQPSPGSPASASTVNDQVEDRANPLAAVFPAKVAVKLAPRVRAAAGLNVTVLLSVLTVVVPCTCTPSASASFRVAPEAS